MPKKEKSEIKEIILQIIKSQFISKIKDAVDNLQNAINVAQKKIFRSILALFLLILGLTFLLISGIFAMIDLLGFSRTYVFLGTGIILLLLSIIIWQSARLLKFSKRR